MSILKKYFMGVATICMLMCSIVITNLQAQQKRNIEYLDTLKIGEIEMGSTLDYIRFSKQSKIEVADFVRNNPSLFYITNNQKMFIKKTEEDELGFVHYRFGQTYMGIPIEDADYWIHYKDSLLTTANGKLANLSKIVFRAARLTKGEAISYFQNHEKKKAVKGIKKADDSGEYETRLLWASRYKDTTGTIQEDYYLAYRVTNKSNSLVAYLDAETGEVKYDFYESYGCQAPVSFNSYYYGTKNVTTNLQGGLYRMQDICPSVCANLNKNIQVTDENDNIITNTNNTWTTDLQRKAATSQWAASNTYNYFCEKHNWKGYDNNNSLLKVKLMPTPAGQWEAGLGRMLIGNVNSNLNTPICTQDVIAHEYTHGFVIANISNPGTCMAVQGFPDIPAPSCATQSINEAVADMLGIAVEYYALPSSANFLIAEDAIPTGLRNVSNPKSKGYPNCFKSSDNPSPTNWSNSIGQPMTYNNGAVITFWFHLLCNGGSGNVDDKPNNPAYNVTAIGMDKAAKIVVRAVRYYGFSDIGFEQFRRATIEACKDLYGNCSNEVFQTAKAWNAVGLVEFINYYDQNSTPIFCGDFGGNPQKNEIYYVQNAINIPTSTCTPQSLIVKSGSMLVVTSAQGILLKPGFRAEAGSRFKATATSCLTQTLRKGQGLEENFISTTIQNSLLNTWSLSPNPSQEEDLYLNFPKDEKIIKISLSDIQGKTIKGYLLFEVSTNERVKFTCPNLQKGIYLVHITTQNGVQKTLKLTRN